jgi:D-glycero-D-manno-heptose 1,7-bisphosphate phosphatase
MNSRAVFLDRDGTLNVNTHYLIDFEDFCPMPDAIEGLRELKKLGFRFFVVSNQSGVARGYFTAEEVESLHRQIQEFFRNEGIELEGFAFCPHHPEGVVSEYSQICNCRKPMPGMVLELARHHGLDLSQSYMVGDQETDVACGQAAGTQSVLIRAKNHGPEITNRVHLGSFETERFETLLEFANFLKAKA